MHRQILAMAAAALPAFAQAQAVKPPIAQYWMSIETAAGMNMPGMSPAMAGMMGGQAAGGRRMLLQLGSQRAAPGEPRAAHDIPSGMNMGPQLPLVTPRREPTARAERGDRPAGMEKPRGRMLVYWGCGENVRAGQPVLIDFANPGAAASAMTSRRIAQPAGPAYGRSRTYGDWPNQEDAKAVPDSASLAGAHAIKGNYSPEIRFSLDRDFLDRVALSADRNRMRWNAVGRATGYFATLYGAQGQDEIVFWSSSEVQEMGGGLMDYLPPAEAARLVREKVLLPPGTTECTVPAEVVKKAGTPMINFIAYGDEANFAHPPRPQNPKAAWAPEWAVKVRFKSTASLLLGEGAEGAGARSSAPRREADEPARDTSAREKPEAPDPLKEGVNILRGILGR